MDIKAARERLERAEAYTREHGEWPKTLLERIHASLLGPSEFAWRKSGRQWIRCYAQDVGVALDRIEEQQSEIERLRELVNQQEEK